MISLFFGEFYALSRSRRWLLIPLGFVLSMTFNVCRMSLLTFIAAKKGVPAISQYHDPAGITITIICTLALWGLAVLLKKTKTTGQRTTGLQDYETTRPQTPDPRPASSQLSVVGEQKPEVRSRRSVIGSLAFVLIVWLIVVEAGVQLWYRHLESHISPGPAWSLNFPQDNATLKDLPIDAATRNLLRFDEGRQAGWTESDGTQWQVFYFSWLPGRVAGYLAKRHTPEICLQATGLKMLSGPELTVMNINGVELPIRCYVFETDNGVIQVFHCRWEAGVKSSAYVEQESTRFNLVRGIWAGRGDKGQKVLEVIISGMDDPSQAKAALMRQLKRLIKVENLQFQ
jgi:exosortase/archaeosortase family protein